MSFTGLPLPAVFGIAATALAVLAALHLLHSRPRHMAVVTTMFWREALSAARPRSLWQRFRSLWSFVLLAAVIGLLAAAVSHGVWSLSAEPARHTVWVIDAGCSMSGPVSSAGQRTRWAAAVEEIRLAAKAPAAKDHFAVVVADPLPRVVHAFDQPAKAVARDLAQVKPADQPADAWAAMNLARSLLAGHVEGRIVWISDRPAPAWPAVGQSDNDTVDVQWVRVGEPIDNAAIVSVLFLPEVGNPFVGKLHCRAVWFGAGSPALRLQATTADGRVVVDGSKDVEPGGAVEFESELIPADGSRLSLRLEPADAVTADNVLEVQLPRRPAIAVGSSMSMPAALRVVLQSIGARIDASVAGASAVRVVDDDHAAEVPGPAIVLVQHGSAVMPGKLVTVDGRAPWTRELSFENATCGVGAGITGEAADTTPLLVADMAVLAAWRELPDRGPQLLLSSALWSEGATITRRAAWPMLMARAVQRLAGWNDAVACVPASRVLADPLWTRPLDLLATSVGDRSTSNLSAPTEAMVDVVKDASHGSTTGQGLPLSSVLILVAVALVLLETWLHARGRIV